MQQYTTNPAFFRLKLLLESGKDERQKGFSSCGQAAWTKYGNREGISNGEQVFFPPLTPVLSSLSRINVVN